MGENETRAGEPYIPPKGWIRYGLNVSGKYDKGNNDWLAYDNSKGEWCIAYHGVAQGQTSDSVKNVIQLIVKNNLKKEVDKHMNTMMIADIKEKKLVKEFIVHQIQK